MVILTLFFIFVTFFLQNTCKYHFFFVSLQPNCLITSNIKITDIC